MTPVTVSVHRNRKGELTISAPLHLWRAAGVEPAPHAVVAERLAAGASLHPAVDKLLAELEKTP
ncbi:MAG: hypothetical protein U1A72_16925 [Sulfuritalea sp.]|nr:hypothetical protein [Sulfuritalea sp.]